jgi:hypothetical protein
MGILALWAQRFLHDQDPNRKLATQCATPPMTRGREEFGREIYHAYGRRVTMLVPLWRRNGKIV